MSYLSPLQKKKHCANLGVIYFELENYTKAIPKFRISEELNGGQDNNLSKYNIYYLGYSYLNIGNHGQAVKFFEKYLYFEPKDVEILELVGWCNLLLYNHETALKNYLRLAELEPSKPAYLIEAAKILKDLEKKNEANNCLELAKKQNHSIALNLLVDSLKHRLNNDFKKAVQYLERAIKEILADKNSSLYFQLADVYILLSEYKRESGDLEGSISVLEGLLEITPDDLWAINCLALEYGDQGIKLDKALAQTDRCLKYQPENPFFMDTKGWVLFKMGKTEEAKDLIEKSLKLNPNDKEAQAHYKAINNQLGP